MIPFYTYYIDTTKSARSSLVQSGSSSTPKKMDDVVAGDILRIAFQFLSNSQLDVISGDATMKITASIGGYDSGPIVAQTNWYYSASWGVTSSINLSPLSSSVSGLESNTFVFELKGNDNSVKRTFLQTPIEVYNRVI